MDDLPAIAATEAQCPPALEWKLRQSMVNNLMRSDNLFVAWSLRRTRHEELLIRAAACAAADTFAESLRYNPSSPGNYVASVLNVLYGFLRLCAPRELPIPPQLNRSTFSKAMKRFSKRWNTHYLRLQKQVQGGRRPVQPPVVTKAMAMLPRARGGQGGQRAEEFLRNVSAELVPVTRLMRVGLSFLMIYTRHHMLTKLRRTKGKE